MSKKPQPAPAPSPQPERPPRGGSFLRQPDGSLKQTACTASHGEKLDLEQALNAPSDAEE